MNFEPTVGKKGVKGMTGEISPKKVAIKDYFKKGYVLVADDMPNMRRTLKNMLRQMGVESVLEADDGTTALHTLRGNPGCKFALLDWNMPRMNGIITTKEIRADESIQDTPILLITAEMEDHLVAQAGEVGVNGYIIKPFIVKTLQDKIQHIIDARENPPEYIKLLKQGEEHVSHGQLQEALSLFQQVKEIKESARIHVHIGETFELLGEPDKAQASYTAAIAHNAKFLKAYVKSAALHLKRGNKDEALELLEKACVISPDNAERHIAIGKVYLEKGNESKAQQAFTAAIRHEPTRSTEIAEELLKIGKPELAETYFRHSLLKHVDTINIYNRLGIALRRQGKWKEAIKEYETALTIDSQDGGLYFNMAKSYLEGEDREKAEKYFKKALELSPDLTVAKEELAAMGALRER